MGKKRRPMPTHKLAPLTAPRKRAKKAKLWEASQDCGICGKPLDGGPEHPTTTLDHIVPLREGGSHSLSNLQLAHLMCNWEKDALAPGETHDRFLPRRSKL